MAPALRGSQAWLSRETETKHVITSALMGEVQAARGMSSKGSQHEVGQDAQRAQSRIYCRSLPSGEPMAELKWKEEQVPEEVAGNRVDNPIPLMRNGQCMPHGSLGWESPFHA